MTPWHVLLAASLWLAITVLITRPRSYCRTIDEPREAITRGLKGTAR